MGLRKPIRKIRKGVRLGKPANRIRVFSGGREVVRSAAIYMERTHEMAKRQGNKCAICCLSFAIVGNPATSEGVEDLIWVLTMLPEFQLVY